MKQPSNISNMVALALAEDVGAGDVTASLIPDNHISKANLLCRDMAVLAGIPWFNAVFHQVDANVRVQWLFQESDQVDAGSVICSIEGKSSSILTAERTALNFLQTLSATATQTRRYVDLLKGTHTRILDTRKTLPGFRTAQKYAVVCGGGENHRMGLYDRVLIKENHIHAAGSIAQAVSQARKLHPKLLVEVETENLAEFDEAVVATADIIMLDNFTLENMRTAVERNNQNKASIALEASGGVTLDTVRTIAETGVDYISVGEITKHIRAIDLSLRFA